MCSDDRHREPAAYGTPGGDADTTADTDTVAGVGTDTAADAGSGAHPC